MNIRLRAGDYFLRNIGMVARRQARNDPLQVCLILQDPALLALHLRLYFVNLAGLEKHRKYEFAEHRVDRCARYRHPVRQCDILIDAELIETRLAHQRSCQSVGV